MAPPELTICDLDDNHFTPSEKNEIRNAMPERNNWRLGLA